MPAKQQKRQNGQTSTKAAQLTSAPSGCLGTETLLQVAWGMEGYPTNGSQPKK